MNDGTLAGNVCYYNAIKAPQRYSVQECDATLIHMAS